MAESTHKVEVVPLVLEKHPNADRLSVAKVFGYTCVTETSQWFEVCDGCEGALKFPIRKAAFIPPDSLVDVTKPEFLFLAKDAKDGKARIKAKRIRGVQSFGLLVPAPVDAVVGDCVADRLGVTHYDPPIRGTQKTGINLGGESAPGPNVFHVKYDVEAGRRYAESLFVPGEPVVVTEKIHGANARYVFHDGQMYCGSRTEWKREYPSYDHINQEFLVSQGVDEAKAKDIIDRLHSKPKQQNTWWKALADTPGLREFCERHPGAVVYGEVYGAVQDLNYGCASGEVRFAAFDVMQDGEWLRPAAAYDLVHMAYQVPWVPLVVTGEFYTPYDFDKICELADGPSLVPGANHIREGVVVSPSHERRDDWLGRVKLKWVSAAYLERCK